MAYFSIVIPLYNKESYIENTIKSVLKQDFEDFEIIIVNDGSTDNSLNLLNQFTDPRIHIIKQKNQGVSSARNNGILNSTGQYIALLDADDLWYPDHLTELKNQTLKFPDAGLFCSNYEVFLDEFIVKPAQFNFQFKNNILIIDNFFEASAINCVAWTSGVAFRKKQFQELGGFDVTLDTNEDLDLWIKFGLNHDISFNPKITMTYKAYINDSLTKVETNYTRLNFLNRFITEEKTNPSLKYFLDINRYALAIRCKILKERDIYSAAKGSILMKNLNLKQQFLINSPRRLIVLFKGLQKWLIKRNVYLSAFR
ncbi:MAG: glycosyltransferase family 2 protein [Winogradskyella sp.]|uniref:glycosyltransferase family 2 protein n=1 Tax=Winogradskyella sp. TaxID=1883156 RepID=UPI0025F4010F|nr:glycosyltransferase family 2 protein [Winogradskyella sp.]NRB61249.1 glycosyltransferase family 2 protein [Winogradskyella sp.]